jgi:hypothetical protein
MNLDFVNFRQSLCSHNSLLYGTCFYTISLQPYAPSALIDHEKMDATPQNIERYRTNHTSTVI